VNPAAALKSMVSGAPGLRVKKLEGDIEAVDRKVEKIAARAAELQKALDDGDGDAPAIVATATAIATARAERAVLVCAREAAQKLAVAAEAEEAARQEAARRARLLAEAENAGKALEEALIGVCGPLRRFNALIDQLDSDRPKLGIEDYCRAASEIACKDVPRWPIRGNAGGDTWTFDLQLTVPFMQVTK
jgi:hypothetical protein